MEEGRLPKEVLEWRPSVRRKRGRPKLTWAEEIRGMMGEKRLNEKIGLIEAIGGERSHDCEMGAGRCGNIGQPAK